MNAKLKLPLIAAAFLSAAALALPGAASAKSNAGAIAAGIIAGAAVGAVVSSEINHPKKVYVQPAPAPQPWPQTYSPQPGIWCYPAQRACYKADGGYSGTWTYRIYAR